MATQSWSCICSPFVSLAVTQLMIPNVDFIGHLAGILAGKTSVTYPFSLWLPLMVIGQSSLDTSNISYAQVLVFFCSSGHRIHWRVGFGCLASRLLANANCSMDVHSSDNLPCQIKILCEATAHSPSLAKEEYNSLLLIVTSCDKVITLNFYSGRLGRMATPGNFQLFWWLLFCRYHSFKNCSCHSRRNRVLQNTLLIRMIRGKARRHPLWL